MHVHPALRNVQDGETPLMLAARLGTVRMAMMLLQAKADKDARDKVRWRPPLVVTRGDACVVAGVCCTGGEPQGHALATATQRCTRGGASVVAGV